MKKFVFALTMIAGFNAAAAEIVCTTTIKTGQEAVKDGVEKVAKVDARTISLDKTGNVAKYDQSLVYIVDAMAQGGGSFTYTLGVKNGRIVAATLEDEVKRTSASIDNLKNQTTLKLSTFSRDSEDKTVSATLECSLK